MDFAQLVIIAILVEAIWENTKMIWKDKKINVSMIGSLILGVIVCIFAHIGIFNIVGINLSIEAVDWVLTGIVVSRGANFVHDLFSKIKGEK